MWFEAFYSLVREFTGGRLTREGFIVSWAMAQRRQCIAVAEARK